MGVFKFQLPSQDMARLRPHLRKAYVTGQDRTPSRLDVELRSGVLVCHRDNNESGRLFIPWSVEGLGELIIGTATLGERFEPYDLVVELARGRLNEVRNQLADWVQMGLRTTPELDRLMAESSRSFVTAVVARDAPDLSHAAAQASLAASCKAGTVMVEAYTRQVLHNRLSATPKLPTFLGGVLAGDPKVSHWTNEAGPFFNAVQLPCSWKTIAPTEGRYRWDQFDAQLAWCRKHRLAIQAGPVLEFTGGALPDWLWLWEGDFDSILGFVEDYVRQVMTRYRGKVPVWHLVHRAATSDCLGLSEEEQIRLTARVIQVARQVDTTAQLTIGVDRPWAEWMGSSTFQLGPLHMADYLVRAELGLGGLALEIAPGYSAPGSHLRDLFDFSKMLDLYALLNLPLYLWIVLPSSSAADPLADPAIQVESAQWPSPPDETMQAEWASKWVALAVAKPFVRSVVWMQASDAEAHRYPHGGLYRPDRTPKPLLSWLRTFRGITLA
jgi:hypothetical protein